jgi:signal transduction histidine kinase
MGSVMPGRLCLIASVMLCELLRLQAIAAGDTPTTERTPPVAIESLQAMLRDEIERGDRVCVQGVVTFRQGREFLAVQDDTAGIWVRFNATPPDIATCLDSLRPGDLVEVIGTLTRGAYAPAIIATHIGVLGKEPMKAAVSADPERLFRGADNGRRVMISGVVQGYRDDGAVWNIVVESAAHRLVMQVDKESLGWDPAELIDAEVRLTGVASAVRNTRGEFLLPRLFVARAADVELLSTPQVDAFAAPQVPLAAIAAYRPAPAPGHRVRTAGIVTRAIPGRFFYIQQGLEGVRVETASTEPPTAGDIVEVAGFIRMRHGLGTLSEAVFRTTGHTQPPVPLDMQPADILAVNVRARTAGLTARPASYHGCLIRCTGTLLEVPPPQANGCRLLIEADDLVVTATLLDTGYAVAQQLTPGSTLALTGIAELGLEEDQDVLMAADPWPDHVTMLLGSAADIEVLRTPSWWTPRRLMAALATAVAIVAAAGLWVGILRRQVARQSALLAAELEQRHRAAVEHEAALRERSRLAANLHDTVLQTVTGVGFQLKVCQAMSDRAAASPQSGTDSGTTPSSAPGQLDVARRMVDHAIQQLRGTVWALHTIPTGDEPFGQSLRSLVARLGEGHPAEIRVHADDATLATHALPDVVAGTLLLVVQEAISNALRHARATVIDVTATLSSGDASAITVCVHDDGVGFEPGLQPGATLGHFGLEGMRDRVERVAGELLVESRVGRGTTITARVPLTAGSDVGLSERPMAVYRAAAPIPS